MLGDGHSGYGLYVASAEYPEEGTSLLVDVPSPTVQPVQSPPPDAKQRGKRIRDLALELEKTGRIISCLTVTENTSSQERTDMIARNRGIQCALEDAIAELVDLAALKGKP